MTSSRKIRDSWTHGWQEKQSSDVTDEAGLLQLRLIFYHEVMFREEKNYV